MTLVWIITICAKHIRNKIQDYLFVNIGFSNFPSFIFKINLVFMEEKDNPVWKVAIDGEKLDGIDIDGILNFSIENVGIWK